MKEIGPAKEEGGVNQAGYNQAMDTTTTNYDEFLLYR